MKWLFRQADYCDSDGEHDIECVGDWVSVNVRYGDTLGEVISSLQPSRKPFALIKPFKDTNRIEQWKRGVPTCNIRGGPTTNRLGGRARKRKRKQ